MERQESKADPLAERKSLNFEQAEGHRAAALPPPLPGEGREGRVRQTRSIMHRDDEGERIALTLWVELEDLFRG
jgi:hypothetical protein